MLEGCKTTIKLLTNSTFWAVVFKEKHTARLNLCWQYRKILVRRSKAKTEYGEGRGIFIFLPSQIIRIFRIKRKKIASESLGSTSESPAGHDTHTTKSPQETDVLPGCKMHHSKIEKFYT